MAFKMKGYSPFDKEHGDEPKKIYVSNKYKKGDHVSEEDLEAKFKRTGSDPKNYPQLSVEDYSKVMVDTKGPYVVQLSE